MKNTHSQALSHKTRLLALLLVFALALCSLAAAGMLTGCKDSGSGGSSGTTGTAGTVQGNATKQQAPAGFEEYGNTSTDKGSKASGTAGESGNSKKSGSSESSDDSNDKAAKDKKSALQENGTYTSKTDVSRYLLRFGHLPSNFVTKGDARRAGWDSSEGNLWDVCPGKSIGGSQFTNSEKTFPQVKGRIWYECDINYEGGFRGAERLIYSNDGIIYYTGDHYKTYELLNGDAHATQLGEKIIAGGSWSAR